MLGKHKTYNIYTLLLLPITITITIGAIVYTFAI